MTRPARLRVMKMAIEQEKHPMEYIFALAVITATVGGAFWFFGVKADREHRRSRDKDARARFARPMTEVAAGLPQRSSKRDFGRR